MIAKELMTEDPVTILMNAKVAEAVRLLQTLDIRHLPVVDDEGTLVGILSDRDLRGLTIPAFVGDERVGNVQAGMEARVASLMNTNLVCVDVEAEVSEIVELMLENKIGAVPVVDGDGDLVGIVSYIDVLRELAGAEAAE